MIKLITPRQQDFVATIAAERSAAIMADRAMLDRYTDAVGGIITIGQASALIDAIKALPRNAVAGAAKAEPGFYVRADGEALRVVTTQDGKRTYAKRFVVADGRASWEYAPGVGATLAGLTPMDGPAAAAIGLRWNFCVRCCAALGGDTPAAKCSAIVGYGATCAKREGWPFPQGVKAQRDLIAKVAPVAA